MEVFNEKAYTVLRGMSSSVAASYSISPGCDALCQSTKRGHPSYQRLLRHERFSKLIVPCYVL